MKKVFATLLLLFHFAAIAQEAGLSEKSGKWYFPDHIKLQFAGNIGFMSGGPGYISRNRTLETDLMFGYLPQKFGGDALVSITSKISYSPWRIPLRNTFNIVPFSLGFYMSYTFGPQFDTKWPSYYPEGYYWWATAIRPGAFIGGKAGKDLQLFKRKRAMELYYELGTYDLLLISYVQNTGYLKFGDILNLAFGVKMGF